IISSLAAPAQGAPPGGARTPRLAPNPQPLPAARAGGAVAEEPLSPMVNRNLLRQFDPVDVDFQHQLEEDFQRDILDYISDEKQVFETNKIVEGKILNIVGDDVIVDVGYKSEGVIKLDEFKEDGTDQLVVPKVGDTIQVLLETVEDEYGVINL